MYLCVNCLFAVVFIVIACILMGFIASLLDFENKLCSLLLKDLTLFLFTYLLIVVGIQLSLMGCLL